MNDLEKLFEHAPEGATEIVACSEGGVRYATSSATWPSISNSWAGRVSRWKTIATRPQPEQPRKTVEDAVEWLMLGHVIAGYESSGLDVLTYCVSTNSYHFVAPECPAGSGKAKHYYTICTREEFESCVAAKAKSEPEWTHVVNGSECVLLDPGKDCDGYYITKTHYGAFELAKEHELKPIKPTITKSQSEAVMQFAAEHGLISEAQIWTSMERDITD